jgi:hypothetical protein
VSHELSKVVSSFLKIDIFGREASLQASNFLLLPFLYSSGRVASLRTYTEPLYTFPAKWHLNTNNRYLGSRGSEDIMIIARQTIVEPTTPGLQAVRDPDSGNRGLRGRIPTV